MKLKGSEAEVSSSSDQTSSYTRDGYHLKVVGVDQRGKRRPTGQNIRRTL